MPPYCIRCNADLAGDPGATGLLCGRHVQEQAMQSNREDILRDLRNRRVGILSAYLEDERWDHKGNWSDHNKTYKGRAVLAVKFDEFDEQGRLTGRTIHETFTLGIASKRDHGNKNWPTFFRDARAALDGMLACHRRVVEAGWRPSLTEAQRLQGEASTVKSRGWIVNNLERTRIFADNPDTSNPSGTYIYRFAPDVEETYFLGWEDPNILLNASLSSGSRRPSLMDQLKGRLKG